MEEPLLFLTPNRIPECGVYFDRENVGFHLQLTDGPLELAYDDTEYSLAGEWLWVTQPGPRVRFGPAGNSTWFHRHVGFMGIRVHRWQQAGLWPSEPCRPPAGNRWKEVFDELFILTKIGDGWARHRATNLVERVLIECAESKGVRLTEGTWLDDVIRKMGEFEFAPDYAELAAHMGLSESALRRRFKQESGGLAIHEFVVLNRIGRAKTLLEESDLPIVQIAERCGYASTMSFARQFHDHALMAPGEYRRKMGGSGH